MTRDKAILSDASPASTVARFIDYFNAACMAYLDLLFAPPCVFILDTETHVFERYSDAVYFSVLKKLVGITL